MSAFNRTAGPNSRKYPEPEPEPEPRTAKQTSPSVLSPNVSGPTVSISSALRSSGCDRLGKKWHDDGLQCGHPMTGGRRGAIKIRTRFNATTEFCDPVFILRRWRNAVKPVDVKPRESATRPRGRLPPGLGVDRRPSKFTERHRQQLFAPLRPGADRHANSPAAPFAAPCLSDLLCSTSPDTLLPHMAPHGDYITKSLSCGGLQHAAPCPSLPRAVCFAHRAKLKIQNLVTRVFSPQRVIDAVGGSESLEYPLTISLRDKTGGPSSRFEQVPLVGSEKVEDFSPPNHR